MLFKKSSEKLTEREQVAKRREEVLSRGRKFKYPLQYAKHRVAIIAAIISVIAIASLGLLTYASLYVFGSSNEVLYRTTQVFPLPVAEIDGEPVRFSDYLLLYRSSIIVVDQNDKDIDATIAEYKRTSLDTAERYAYANKLAHELGIEVSEAEVAELFDSHRKAGGTERSEESFLKILSDNFNISKSEYNHLLKLLLIKMKVSAAIDTNANKLKDDAMSLIRSGMDLASIADKLGSQVSYEDTGGLQGLDNIDGGRSNKAFALNPGEVSEPFISGSGDAFYIVKLIEKTDTEANYASIEIPFTEFDRRFEEIIKNDNYKEYITLENIEETSEED